MIYEQVFCISASALAQAEFNTGQGHPTQNVSVEYQLVLYGGCYV